MNRFAHFKYAHFVTRVFIVLIAAFVIAIIINAYFIDNPAVPRFGSGYTLGVVSDGDDVTPLRPRLMVKDLNHLISDLPSGWQLNAIAWLGDIGYGNGVALGEKAWRESSASTTPLFFVQGNHEADSPNDVLFLRNYFPSYSKDFNLKAADIAQASTTNYSYDVGDIHVVVVNQYTSTTTDKDLSLGKGGGYIHPQVFNWLKKDLSQNTKPHVVVLGHEPMFPKKRHVGDSLDADQSNRNQYLNLLLSYGASAHLVGHTHVSKLEETIYDYSTRKPSIGGMWELDAGAFGTKANGAEGNSYPSLGFFHSHSQEFGDYSLVLVQGKGFPSWSATEKLTKSQKDLSRIVLVNTWKGSGTTKIANGFSDMNYFVDYTGSVTTNPSWQTNNRGRWWEPGFNITRAEWTSGELAVGYDITNALQWLNTIIDASPEEDETNTPQVHSIMGRVDFNVSSSETFPIMELEHEFKGGLVVWLNGTVVFNSIGELPQTPAAYFDFSSSKTAPTTQSAEEVPQFTKVDISEFKHLLTSGHNVLTFWNTNEGTNAPRLGAAIRLSIQK